MLNLELGQADKSVSVCALSHVWLFTTLWTVTCQASLSLGLSRQEYWVGCYFPLQGSFLTQGSNLCLLHLLYWQADSLPQHHLWIKETETIQNCDLNWFWYRNHCCCNQILGSYLPALSQVSLVPETGCYGQNLGLQLHSSFKAIWENQ